MMYPDLIKMAETRGLVLASGSPRRRELLTQAEIDFDIVIPDIDEELTEGLTPAEQVLNLARQKVTAVPHDGRRVYLSCDTIVVLDDEILNKPEDEDHAFDMLSRLSGRTHSVFSGLVLFDAHRNEMVDGFDESRVHFNHVTDEQIRNYIAGGEPMDKAGAYGIQGLGRFLVDSVEGNIDTVIGLPMGVLDTLAERIMAFYG